MSESVSTTPITQTSLVNSDELTPAELDRPQRRRGRRRYPRATDTRSTLGPKLRRTMNATTAFRDCENVNLQVSHLIVSGRDYNSHCSTR
jgi:hypothetical protein